jgi:hypothetical protein
VVAVSAKLVGEVVEGTPGGGEGCGHIQNSHYERFRSHASTSSAHA